LLSFLDLSFKQNSYTEGTYDDGILLGVSQVKLREKTCFNYFKIPIFKISYCAGLFIRKRARDSCWPAGLNSTTVSGHGSYLGGVLLIQSGLSETVKVGETIIGLKLVAKKAKVSVGLHFTACMGELDSNANSFNQSLATDPLTHFLTQSLTQSYLRVKEL
jgi:hypothetical protein